MANGFTAPQRKFIREHVRGLPAYQAYKKAYKNVKTDEAAHAASSRLLRNVKVKKEIARLQEKTNDDTVLEVKEKRIFLAQCVRTPLSKITEDSVLLVKCRETYHEGLLSGIVYEKVNPLDAIKADNVLAGHNKPQETKVTFSLTDLIRARNAQLEA